MRGLRGQPGGGRIPKMFYPDFLQITCFFAIHTLLRYILPRNSDFLYRDITDVT